MSVYSSKSTNSPDKLKTCIRHERHPETIDLVTVLQHQHVVTRVPTNVMTHVTITTNLEAMQKSADHDVSTKVVYTIQKTSCPGTQQRQCARHENYKTPLCHKHQHRAAVFNRHRRRHFHRSGHSSYGDNLNLRREFVWTFLVAKVKTIIIGADFLQHFKLSEDLAGSRLTDSPQNTWYKNIDSSTNN